MNRIKDILISQGRSQVWLADKIGRSYVVTTNYCNNKTQPSLSILRKIADVLEVDIRELLNGKAPDEDIILLSGMTIPKLESTQELN
jgi:putative transcriptional regulator